MSGIGKNKSKKWSCIKLVDEESTQYANLGTAEYLNNYYVNVGPKLANPLEGEWGKNKCKIQVDSVFNFPGYRSERFLI